MLRCGGGKALTKQGADENTLKFHVPVGGMNKVEADTLVICGAQVGSELEEKIEVAPIRNEFKHRKNVLGKIMPKLYNLENCVGTEKPLKIDLDLDLYQMEKV